MKRYIVKICNGYYGGIGDRIYCGMNKEKAVFKALKWYLKGTTTSISEENGKEREWTIEGIKKGVNNILDWLYTSEKDFWYYGFCGIDVIDVAEDEE